MKPTLRDMYGALPTIKYNIKTFNGMGVLTLSAFFLSASIVISGLILLYKHIV
jgi:hypothetical protein